VPFILKFLINKENIVNLFCGPVNLIDNKYYINHNMFETNIIRRLDNVNIKIDFEAERDLIVSFLKDNNLILI
jgi:hypothetical protein